MKHKKKYLVLTSVLVILITIIPAGLLLFRNNEKSPTKKAADEFYMGGDVSSLMEVEEHNGKFYYADGTEGDALAILQSYGMDSVRLRIWNDPIDENGKPYANGHNDLETAKIIGKRASDLGMRVLIDFHYSDYWADPSSQKVPKDWKSLTFEEKEDALYSYTKESLKTLLDSGVNVTMVQVGNETTSGIAGEQDWNKMTPLMSAGSKAVREISAEYDREILVAIHFTGHEHYDWFAGQLKEYNVDYDVFAASYYPYWHGEIASSEAALQNIIDTYNKKVLFAEFSYPFNLNNFDTATNTISFSSGLPFYYPASKQGQEEAFLDVKKAAINLGDDCLGIFYWEPAWIGYEGKDYTGSPWDNQALFDQNGKPLPALSHFLLTEDH